MDRQSARRNQHKESIILPPHLFYFNAFHFPNQSMKVAAVNGLGKVSRSRLSLRHGNQRMNSTPYYIPAAPAETEILVVNSRFIASLSPAFSVEEARAFQKSIRQRFPDATHHVPAFVIGHGNSVITHCSDDGEPSGTAGRPALAVLQGSGLGDAAVVVTRYFGGTLLGTGGLVKAYGDAVREVLKRVRRAVKVPTTTIGLQLPYPLYEQALRLAAACGGETLESQFLEDVTLMLRFRDEQLGQFEAQLSELSAGKVSPLVLEQNPHTIFPVD